MDHFSPSYFVLLGPLDRARLAERIIPKRFRLVMEILLCKDVRFLVGGDMVFPLHGVPGKFTDLDLLIEPNENNIGRFVRCMRSEKTETVDTAALERFLHREGTFKWCLPFLKESGSKLNALINPSLPYKEFFRRRISISLSPVTIDLLSVDDLKLMRLGTDDEELSNAD